MRPTRAIVDLAAIRRNLRRAASLAPASKNVAVVKANAYGHGATAIAGALRGQADAFAVAFLEEAAQLRKADVHGPILVLEGLDRASEMQEAAALGCWPVLHDAGQVERLASARLASPLGAWIKIDTGMRRLGLEPEAVPGVLNRLAGTGNLQGPPVLCTHLACADDRESDMTGKQLARFGQAHAATGLPASIANSAGILYWRQSHAEWNRPGYLLYGNCPSGAFDPAEDGLAPAMTLVSEVMALRRVEAGQSVGYGRRWVASRPSVIGTIPIGYADGYPRHAPNGTPVLVRGQRVPLAGTVSMDMITVDMTDFDSPRVGDPVELWGPGLNVNEVAAHAGTIGYELLAGLTGRIPITYADGDV